MKKIAIIGFLTLFSVSLKAQVILPYFTGFDNAFEQSGWIEFKKAASTFSHWDFSGSGYSGTNCISHSYSPSTGITLTDNWFVSPAFLITGGGKLDSIRYMFSGFSMPESGDTIGVYLLNGSPDPSLASSILLLYDFRGNDYTTDGSYRIKTNIILPFLSGPSFIAIRYRNTDCSSKWLTVNFDNLAISGNKVGINEFNPFITKINMYPNPVKDYLTIENNANIDQSLEIVDMTGKSVYTTIICSNTTIDISSFQRGVYIVKLKSGKETLVRKFVKE